MSKRRSAVREACWVTRRRLRLVWGFTSVTRNTINNGITWYSFIIPLSGGWSHPLLRGHIVITESLLTTYDRKIIYLNTMLPFWADHPEGLWMLSCIYPFTPLCSLFSFCHVNHPTEALLNALPPCDSHQWIWADFTVRGGIVFDRGDRVNDYIRGSNWNE